MHDQRADGLVLGRAVRSAESLDLETGRGPAAKAHVSTFTIFTLQSPVPVVNREAR